MEKARIENGKVILPVETQEAICVGVTDLKEKLAFWQSAKAMGEDCDGILSLLEHELPRMEAWQQAFCNPVTKEGDADDGTTSE